MQLAPWPCVSQTLIRTLPSELDFRVAQNVLPWEEIALDRLRRGDLPRLSSLTAVLLARNDAHTVGSVIDYAARLLPEVADDFELIVVDDGSADATGEVLSQRQKLCPFLRTITHASSRGYGAALRSGFSAATGSHVFYTTGDGQRDPTELATLIPALGEGARASGAAGFRLIRRDALSRLTLTADSSLVEEELLRQMKRLRLPLAEASVALHPRASGTLASFPPPGMRERLALWQGRLFR